MCLILVFVFQFLYKSPSCCYTECNIRICAVVADHLTAATYSELVRQLLQLHKSMLHGVMEMVKLLHVTHDLDPILAYLVLAW